MRVPCWTVKAPPVSLSGGVGLGARPLTKSRCLVCGWKTVGNDSRFVRVGLGSQSRVAPVGVAGTGTAAVESNAGEPNRWMNPRCTSESSRVLPVAGGPAMRTLWCSRSRRRTSTASGTARRRFQRVYPTRCVLSCSRHSPVAYVDLPSSVWRPSRARRHLDAKLQVHPGSPGSLPSQQAARNKLAPRRHRSEIEGIPDPVRAEGWLIGT